MPGTTEHDEPSTEPSNADKDGLGMLQPSCHNQSQSTNVEIPSINVEIKEEFSRPVRPRKPTQFLRSSDLYENTIFRFPKSFDEKKSLEQSVRSPEASPTAQFSKRIVTNSISGGPADADKSQRRRLQTSVNGHSDKFPEEKLSSKREREHVQADGVNDEADEAAEPSHRRMCLRQTVHHKFYPRFLSMSDHAQTNGSSPASSSSPTAATSAANSRSSKPSITAPATRSGHRRADSPSPPPSRRPPPPAGQSKHSKAPVSSVSGGKSSSFVAKTSAAVGGPSKKSTLGRPSGGGGGGGVDSKKKGASGGSSSGLRDGGGGGGGGEGGGDGDDGPAPVPATRPHRRDWGLQEVDAVGRNRPPFASTLLCYGSIQPGVRPNGQAAPAGQWVIKRWLAKTARRRAEMEVHERIRVNPHRNLVEILSVHPNDGVLMEYCSDGDLQTLMATARRTYTPLATIVGYLRGIMAGLCHLHRLGIVHTDISPRNIFLRKAPPPSEAAECVLGDFGHSYLAGRHQQTRSSVAHHGASFVAPEVEAGDVSTQASDVYSCGRVLSEMLAASAQFAQYESEQRSLGRILGSIAESMCRPDPQVRVTARAALRRLERLPLRAPRPSLGLPPP